jgi:hypothetical protein
VAYCTHDQTLKIYERFFKIYERFFLNNMTDAR